MYIWHLFYVQYIVISKILLVFEDSISNIALYIVTISIEHIPQFEFIVLVMNSIILYKTIFILHLKTFRTEIVLYIIKKYTKQ